MYLFIDQLSHKYIDQTSLSHWMFTQHAAHHIHPSPEVKQLSGFKKITLTVDHYIKAACFPCSPDSPAVSWTGFIHWFCWNHFLWLVFLHQVLHSPQRDPSPRGPSSVPNPLRSACRSADSRCSSPVNSPLVPATESNSGSPPAAPPISGLNILSVSPPACLSV